MEEIWKDIENYEGEYQVSNMGRVKSLKGAQEKFYLLLTRVDDIIKLIYIIMDK